MKYLTLCMVMVGMMEGKKLIIKTNKKNYLAHQKGNKQDKLRNTEMDYNEPAWPNPCSLRKRGEMKNADVLGCGGGIDLKCTGGCLEIYKTLYSCKEEAVSNQKQLNKVKSLCERKDSCRLEASRDFFGNTECPGAPDRDMALWVSYSCNEGEDETKLTGPKRCAYYENVRIKLLARNSQNNKPVAGATASVNFQGDDGLTVVGDEVPFNADGELFVPVSANGKYTGQIKADGFITADFEIEVACSKDNCQVDKLVTLSPVLPPGKTRIMLTWEKANPRDVDIHVMAVKKSDRKLCRTMYLTQNSCKKVSLDLDNRQGGLNGAETVTLLDNTINKGYRYLVGIHDYGFENNGFPFLNSGSSIQVTNGIKTVTKRLQGSGPITKKNGFYFFGCVDVKRNGKFTFKAAPAGTFFAGLEDNAWLDMMNKHC